ncbi:MAG: hypothetical protein AWM53_01511 [Candidatus Dichloromethanomonas elyunquensis]|nr:MAG: hypothetical protein AWM53_01511 [Candidatus Dichloromethanomonas elyunquensis]
MNWNKIRISFYVLVILAIFSLGGHLLSQNFKQPLPKGWQLIRPPHEVSALILQGDILWAGGEEGVYQIRRSDGQVLQKLAAQPELHSVRALLLDNSGRLWIGHDQGLSCWDGHKFTNITTADGLPDNRVLTLESDSAGGIWTGTWGGAVYYRDGIKKILTKNDGLLADMVNVILSDNAGGLWFGSKIAPQGGLSYYKDGKWQYFSVAQGLPHNNISTLYQDREGLVWAGGGLLDRGGACILSKEGELWKIKQVLNEKDVLAGAKVRSLTQDTPGYYWLGSEYDGVSIYKDGKKLVLNEKSGLANSEVKKVLEDAEGNIWIGTRDGLNRLSPEAVQQLYKRLEGMP